MSSALDIGALVGAVRSVVGVRDAGVGLHEPRLVGNECAYVTECIKSGWVSYNGEFVGRFERALADFVGAGRAVAVVNGTSALFMCLKLAGVTADDEVLVPAMTFVATANCVSHVGAVPHLVDISAQTLGLDPRKLGEHLATVGEMRDGRCWNKGTGRRIAAVVPMHCFGNPVDLDPLLEVCERYGLVMVEDAAQSLGSYYKGRHTGRHGRVSSLSFNGNKIITTGGGGAILTDDEGLADEAVHLTTTAKRPHPWEYFHDRVGYNLRMPALCAAVGCAQMEQLEDILRRKQSLAERYKSGLSGIHGVSMFEGPAHSKPNHWLNVLVLDAAHREARDRVIEGLGLVGLGARPAWTLMHHLPMFTGCPRSDLSVAEDLVERLVCLPSGAGL